MKIETFNIKYSKKGGVPKLTEMRNNYETLKDISSYFGVSKERVRQWMIEIYGISYDPRMERRRMKVNAIRELIKIHGVEETKKMYKIFNKSYLEEANKELQNHEK